VSSHSTSSGGAPTSSAADTASTGRPSHADRQAVMYCPYCAEETLFPLEGGGWECRSCLRAFSVTFLGLAVAGRGAEQERP
jgi:ribosomal protein L37AE/L43A